MKNILLIHDEGNTYNNPTLVSLLLVLNKNRFNVTIHGCQVDVPINFSDKIKIKSYSRFFKKVKTFIHNKVCFEYLSNIFTKLEYFYFPTNYDLVIAVDRIGLIDSYHIAHNLNLPILFFSFEITFASETSLRFKKLEKRISNYIDYWFVQDKVRGKLLHLENNLDLNRMVLLPLGTTNKEIPEMTSLRSLLGIPKHKKVAILMGSIADWTLSNEIIRNTMLWPKEWVLIINSFGFNSKKLKNYNSQKIVINNVKKFNTLDDLGILLKDINLGIAFYKSTKGIHLGRNIANIGLASGKIGIFLNYGVPVICNDIGEYSSLILRYKAGIVVDSPHQIHEKLKAFNFPVPNKNSKKLFQEKISFNNYENKLIEIINYLINK